MDGGVKESTVERRLKERCTEEGILCLKLQAAKGWPDRELIRKGRVLFVETKRPKGGRLEPMQVYVRDLLERQGMEWRLVKDREGIESAIRAIKEETK